MKNIKQRLEYLRGEIKERLEYLRGEIKKEVISYGEICELQGLAEHIDPGDNELLEWAGVPENLTERAVMAAWGRAEKRIGKYVNLDPETLEVLVACPPNMLEDSINHYLGRM